MGVPGRVILSRVEYFEVPDLEGAACKGHADPDIFFSDSQKAQRERDKLCPTCPVRDSCEAYGESQVYGVWGFLTKKIYD